MTHPVERRSDYKHITATWTKLTATAAIFATIGAVAMWFGAVVMSPGEHISAVKTEVEAVRDTMVVRTDVLKAQQKQVADDHHRLDRNVRFLIARECMAVDVLTRQTFASLGVSCREIMQELRRNGGD